ncbi:MAG: alpha/beta fold hydrolase [Chloroflexi bacterium]|nr:alpha/beta fold hydrolase [Chloroflexota bacterium]
MTTMSIRDVSLFVQVMGQGYPLVLMHGGPGQDYTTLLSFKALADQFTLIFYDHRCNGHSDSADVSSMTWENLTADADALRQKLGFDKWAVLGHSFGGNVALEYALRYPTSLSHLILMNAGGDQWWVNHNGPEILAKRGYSASTVQADRRFFNGQWVPGEFLSLFIKFMPAYFYRFDLLGLAREMVSGPRMKYRPEVTIFGHGQLLKDWTVMDRLGEIQVPTLVIAGRYDFLFPPEHQAILADRIPNAKLVLIERAGHNPHMERPVETIQAVRDFMSNAKVTANSHG